MVQNNCGCFQLYVPNTFLACCKITRYSSYSVICDIIHSNNPTLSSVSAWQNPWYKANYITSRRVPFLYRFSRLHFILSIAAERKESWTSDRMTRRADRFIGLHFSNPPIMMPIVEIILASNTSEKNAFYNWRSCEKHSQGIRNCQKRCSRFSH